LIIIATRIDKKGPPWYYVCLIGWAIAAAIAWWIDHDLRPKLVADVELFESALSRGEACVMRIQSDAMVEFDEEEDEGACYAFQLDNRRIIFISGQDFYPSARFPNTDFSLVTVYGNGGTQVASFMEKNGRKLKALRKIAVSQKSRLNIPDHMEVVEGDINQIERILSSSKL